MCAIVTSTLCRKGKVAESEPTGSPPPAFGIDHEAKSDAQVGSDEAVHKKFQGIVSRASDNYAVDGV